MPQDDYNERAAKGQALNLAVHHAIAQGTADSNKEIFGLFLRYYDLSKMLQKHSVTDLKQILRDEELSQRST